jgi:hypothetical protein
LTSQPTLAITPPLRLVYHLHIPLPPRPRAHSSSYLASPDHRTLLPPLSNSRALRQLTSMSSVLLDVISSYDLLRYCVRSAVFIDRDQRILRLASSCHFRHQASRLSSSADSRREGKWANNSSEKSRKKKEEERERLKRKRREHGPRSLAGKRRRQADRLVERRREKGKRNEKRKDRKRDNSKVEHEKGKGRREREKGRKRQRRNAKGGGRGQDSVG